MSAEAEHKTEHIPEWKREEVAELTDFVENYNSVGVVNITGIPSKQLQNMRRGLHGSAELRVSRNTLVQRALDAVGDGFDDLEEYISGQIGLIGTNDNPFGLYKELEASKSPAPISAGEISPNDILIPEGDTGVDPGPFVGELQQAGASARIMDGSIHVTEDSLVAEEGDEVSQELANVLAELGMEPKEVGLDLRAVYSDGVMFESDELAIDVDEYRTDIETAAAFARNLSVNAVYPTEQTAPLLISKATGEAKSLGLQAEIESPDVVPDLVSKADAQLRGLAAQIDDEDALPEELRGVEAPATGDAAEEEESTDEEATEAEPEDDDDDDDDDEDAGAGLGAMFG
ncbi:MULTISPECIES: 50S ribosomal protein L10 [unclassified Haladaptatus]|uniref:50S ribosomal protein L10 n=1 Tax=unclassified Haladaptatus TaxID=2622732 RepID=UPI00209C0E83|nr:MULTISPECIES: 50S ribosomal protein L10 [unclassified Haladaptatus]MCO8246415.1 50S ribosomal protein L10 [Haladaptatus sp. AB643]MCO8254652.1 50S ribosomal protein L10 [Haladaptatus sp. AB618]